VRIYRVGISGAGFGVEAHLPALLAHPRFGVVALASPSSAQRIAKERNIPNAFSSCEAMVRGCELDAVVVASPPFAHRDDVLAALDAGTHVLCEKPLALNIEQAEEMLAASQDAGTACGVVFEFRFVPQRAAIEELIANGHLMPPREIEITHLSGFLRAGVERERGWWFERSRGGGLAQARLSHLIDAANWMAGGAPLRTFGLLRTANPERRDANGAFISNVDDGSFALLDYGDGLVARLAADATTQVDSFTVAVHAENRTAVASGANAAELTLYTIDKDETNELECAPPRYATFQSINRNVPLLMELYDEFIKQIETGKSALPTFEEGLATQRVLAAIGYNVPT
jgi:predicted dehydrogenase